MSCWLSQVVVPQHAQAVSGGAGGANLGQLLSLLCLVGWTGVKKCCACALQGQGMCAVPQLSPELLCEGGEVSVPCRTCPWQGRGQQCWDMILSMPGHPTVPGVSRAQQAELPAGRSGDELIVYPQHREQEALPGSGQDLALPQPSKAGLSTAGQPRARSLFAVSAAHVTHVSHVPCPLSCRHPSAGRAPDGQHGGHRLQQALSDQ